MKCALERSPKIDNPNVYIKLSIVSIKVKINVMMPHYVTNGSTKNRYNMRPKAEQALPIEKNYIHPLSYDLTRVQS